MAPLRVGWQWRTLSLNRRREQEKRGKGIWGKRIGTKKGSPCTPALRSRRATGPPSASGVAAPHSFLPQHQPLAGGLVARRDGQVARSTRGFRRAGFEVRVHGPNARFSCCRRYSRIGVPVLSSACCGGWFAPSRCSALRRVPGLNTRCRKSFTQFLPPQKKNPPHRVHPVRRALRRRPINRGSLLHRVPRGPDPWSRLPPSDAGR